MTKMVPQLFSGFMADVVTGFASHGAGTISAVGGVAIQKLMERRLNDARDILMDEMRSGDLSLSTARDFGDSVAIGLRYARAAQEGAARLNLRLLAQVISGQAHLGNLVADEFLYWSDILASLRREEVILIATLHQCIERIDSGDERGVIIQEPNTWKCAREKLVPLLFESEELMRSVAGGVTRTGLLVSGRTIDGAETVIPSPLLDKVLKLCDFEAALEKEGR